MSRGRGRLPDTERRACDRLLEGLSELLGPDLLGLWAYGAATQPDRPARPGDLDVHAVLARPPGPELAAAIGNLHDRTARAYGVEWDAWYIAEADARGARPPRHLLHADRVDEAWALHRAHWLAGEYVPLHGVEPPELVPPAGWPELLQALRRELEFLERLLDREGLETAEIAYAVCNACRVLYSVERRDVVVSKRAAARWALGNAPDAWREAIEAATRVYEDAVVAGDGAALRAAVREIVGVVGERLAREPG